MGILAGANELVTAFVGLEMSSISSYILAGFRRRAVKSNEAALKYFILGSFATAFFLYGIAMTYGATGTTRIDLVQTALENMMATQGHLASLPIAGLALIFVGLGFKVVAAPFHDLWPRRLRRRSDAGHRAARLRPQSRDFCLDAANLLRVLRHARTISGSGPSGFQPCSRCSVGNLAALVQTNVKRMLAYSSIAHAGYILVAFAASTVYGVAAVLFYLAVYTFMKVGAFLVIAHLGQRDEKRLEITDYAGLGTKQPVLAACFTLFLFSLLGLPATGGFLGKFFAFQAALDSRIVWLVIIAAINSVIGSVLLSARDHRHVFLGAVEGLHSDESPAGAGRRACDRGHWHFVSRHPALAASSTTPKQPPIPSHCINRGAQLPAHLRTQTL